MATAPKTEIYIALMGVTGAGKSRFISLCTAEQVQIGDGLQSCTQQVQAHAFRYDRSTTVYLVDTPGFNDTNKTNKDILREIKRWIGRSCATSVKLSGIIYLHRINGPRMQGSDMMSVNLLNNLCGGESSPYTRVVLTTTMWDTVKLNDGKQREKELIETENFWGQYLRHGSKVQRHYNTSKSARDIIRLFMPYTDSHISGGINGLVFEGDSDTSVEFADAHEQPGRAWAEEKASLQRALANAQEAERAARQDLEELQHKLDEQERNINRTIDSLRCDQEHLGSWATQQIKEKSEEISRLEEMLGRTTRFTLVETLRGHPGRIASLCFTSDGGRLLVGTELCQVWSWGRSLSGNFARRDVEVLNSCENKGKADKYPAIRFVEVSPDLGSVFVSTAGDKHVCVLQDSGGDAMQKLKAGDLVGPLALSPDKQLLLAARKGKVEQLFIWVRNGGRNTWAEAQKVNLRKLHDSIKDDGIRVLRFSPNNQNSRGGSDRPIPHVLAVGLNGSVILCEVAKQGTSVEVKYRQTLGTRTRDVNSMAWGAGGEYLAAADKEGYLWVWKRRGSGPFMGVVAEQLRQDARSLTDVHVAFSPGGQRLVATAESGIIYTWREDDQGQWQPEAVHLGAEGDALTAVAFRPAGNQIAVGSNETVHIWDLAKY